MFVLKCSEDNQTSWWTVFKGMNGMVWLLEYTLNKRLALWRWR